MKTAARALAFYLPQYHPVPENDKRWGKGFTEWTNVTKAKPLFPGHFQPNLPSELGFYDLRVPEVREQQANLARQYGIEGFVYWHYWFGGGRRILEKIIDGVLSSGEPDFPFCLAWANQSWTGIWHGLEKEIMIEQTYPGIDDHIAHFSLLVRAFKDRRYICIDGKPLLVVYNPSELPDPVRLFALWRDLARQNGFPGLYILGITRPENDLALFGFDGSIAGVPIILGEEGREKFRFPNDTVVQKLRRRTTRLVTSGTNEQRLGPAVANFKRHVECYLKVRHGENVFPCVVPNWDNTPRSGKRGYLFDDPSPELYSQMLEKAVADLQAKPFQERLVFIKSWNEWAEGNHLEPCLRFGRAFLEATRNALTPPVS